MRRLVSWGRRKDVEEEEEEEVDVGEKRFEDRVSLDSDVSDCPKTGRMLRKHRSIGPRLSVDLLREGFSGRRAKSGLSEKAAKMAAQDDQYVTFITSMA